MNDFETVKAKALEMGDHLAGLHPGVQGAILALLLAKWAAGHCGLDREQLLQLHLVGVRQMIPIVLEEHGMKEPLDA
jgi:hypothetical protein